MRTLLSFLKTYALAFVLALGLELMFLDSKLMDSNLDKVALFIFLVAKPAAKDALLLALGLNALNGLLGVLRKDKSEELNVKARQAEATNN
jgi:hypothetical protein